MRLDLDLMLSERSHPGRFYRGTSKGFRLDSR